jgi:hypothetical protein
VRQTAAIARLDHRRRLQQPARPCHDGRRMDELEPGKPAVEPPLVRVVARDPVRRHRRVTSVSGIVLFVCMFLPAVDACGTVMPYEVPPLLPPYLYGLVFALIALSRTPRGMLRGIFALRLVTVLVIVAGAVVIPIAPEVGVVELVLGVALLLIVGLIRTTEPRVAASALVVAAVAMLWFGLWCLTGDALVGVYLSLASSTGLFAGTLLWLRELAARPGAGLPGPARGRRGAGTDSDIFAG